MSTDLYDLVPLDEFVLAVLVGDLDDLTTASHQVYAVLTHWRLNTKFVLINHLTDKGQATN